jgi:dynein heavy chain
MKILHSENKVTTQELRFLMVGGTKTDAPKQNPTDGWLSEKQWASFCEMTETFPEKFKNFDDDFTLKRNDWKEVFNSPEPMQVDWPASWSKKLGPIQKLTVLRILRPDKAVPAIQALITSEMGDHFVEGSGALDLGAVYKDSERNRNEPIIFILSPGVDPIAEIMKLADKMGSRGNVLPLSLG